MLYEYQSISNILLTHGHFLDFKTFPGSKENNDLKVPEKNEGWSELPKFQNCLLFEWYTLNRLQTKLIV